jgi:hypothetical protein
MILFIILMNNGYCCVLSKNGQIFYDKNCDCKKNNSCYKLANEAEVVSDLAKMNWVPEEYRKNIQDNIKAIQRFGRGEIVKRDHDFVKDMDLLQKKMIDVDHLIDKLHLKKDIDYQFEKTLLLTVKNFPVKEIYNEETIKKAVTLHKTLASKKMNEQLVHALAGMKSMNVDIKTVVTNNHNNLSEKIENKEILKTETDQKLGKKYTYSTVHKDKDDSIFDLLSRTYMRLYFALFNNK